ncbi:unnamed protein product [Urochloa decumbens]|uniref:DUF4220 domain-containing protein n=1 Tax=Urochloa decumbens TaxID=240449 RepID=A0ABC9AVT1_9POAL
MAKWLQVWNAWEVQLLVLGSFVLQVFLLSTGRRRRRSTTMFLRVCIWLAYLGADSVAVYALGFLSRQVDGGRSEGRHGHPLAFIWAPFLLIHLGGQDSITAYAIEDNNLWLRHLLNLVVQVALALYVFWKSTGTTWHDDVRLLVPGVLVFLSGFVKYLERTIALKHGKLRSLDSSSAVGSDGDWPEFSVQSQSSRTRRENIEAALMSVAGVRDIFGGRTIYQMNDYTRDAFKRYCNRRACTEQAFKLLEIELAIMYDDLYTKAAVLRTRTGIIARCISQISTGVALVLFFVVGSKQRYYNSADVAVTYLLFVGCICLEVWSTLVMIMVSPWTWDWSQARGYSWIASTSWWLLSSRVGWPEGRPLWSNCVGQYNFLSYLGEYRQHSGSCLWNCKQQLMMLVRRTVNFLGVGKGFLFPISKLLDTRFEMVEEEIKVSIAKVVREYSRGHSNVVLPTIFADVLPKIAEVFYKDFGSGIIWLHVFMEEHFANYAGSQDTATEALVRVCRQLSNYMMYLLVNKPEMLPVSGAAEASLKLFRYRVNGNAGSNVRDGGFLRRAKDVLRCHCHAGSNVRDGGGFLRRAKDVLQWPDLPRSQETAEQMRQLWVRLLLYAAGKSRPEINAAQLRPGGELLTFAWLLLAHNGLGDSGYTRLELMDASRQRQGGGGAYVFHLNHHDSLDPGQTLPDTDPEQALPDTTVDPHGRLAPLKTI